MRLQERSVVVGLAGLFVFVMLPTVHAQRGGRGGNQGLPVATNTITQNPDAYYGKPVTVSAGVEAVLSKTAFVLDQWKATGPAAVQPIGTPILVIAPYLTGRLVEKNYLLVSGQVVKFDRAELARVAAEYTLDLSPEMAAKYQGQPVLVATSVLNSTYTEMARKPLPPPRAEELALSVAMKAIAPAFAALRTAAQESKADAVTASVATLTPALTQTETIWDDLGQSGAAQWARDARSHAAAIERAVAAQNWDAAKASAGALNTLCQNCHGVYRDRLEDGTFRIKAGSF